MSPIGLEEGERAIIKLNFITSKFEVVSFLWCLAYVQLWSPEKPFKINNTKEKNGSNVEISVKRKSQERRLDLLQSACCH